MRALVILAAIGVLVATACTHSAEARCDVSDAAVVFASPGAYVGKRFCGEVYYYSEGELGALYHRPVETMEQRLSVAMLLTARSGRFVGFTEGDQRNVRVVATGTIADVCANECTPVTTAIFLENWEVRRQLR